MSSTTNPPDRATRADLEARYLIALMQRDARVFAERAEARNIMAREAPAVPEINAAILKREAASK